MSDKDTLSGFGLGLIVGAAIGLAIGFLYAPRPGEETREILREKAGVAKEKAADVIEKVKKTATEARMAAQEKLKGTSE